MTTTFDPDEITVRGVEDRAGVESLEALHAERRALIPEYAALKALHGSFGKWDVRRKQLLEAVKVRTRGALLNAGEKITEGYIDAVAHADEQYARLIDEGISGAVRFIELDVRVGEIEDRIRSREIELQTYNRELGLQR